MPQELKFNDIFDPDVNTGLSDMNKSLAEMNTQLLKMQNMKVGSGKEWQELNTNIKIANQNLELQNELTKQKTAFDKELASLQKQLIKLEKEKGTETKKTTAEEKKAIKEKEKQIKLSKELKQTDKELVIVKQKLEKEAKDGKNVTTSFNKVIALQTQKLKLLKKAHGETSDVYLKEKSNLTKLKKEQSKFRKELKQQEKVVETAKDSLVRMRDELSKLNVQYAKTSATGRAKLAPQIKSLNDNILQQERAVGKAQRNVGNYESGLKGLGGVLGGIGMAMGGAAIAMKGLEKGLEIGKEAFDTVVAFESAIAKVGAVSGATGDELKMLENLAKDLGRKTTYTATEVANLEIELSKMGFAASEIENSAPGILSLAQATGENLATSAEVAGATLRGLGLEANEMGRVTDVMALSFSKSGLDLTKFQESMKLIAPIARASNIDLETTTALLGNLADSGLSGSIAGTGLKNVISKLSNENSALSKELGFTVKNSNDLILAFQMLKEKNIDLTGATELTDERSKAAFLTMVNGIDKIDSLQTALKGASDAYDGMGAAAGIAEQMTTNIEGATKRIKSAYEGLVLGIKVGEGEMQVGITKILDFFSKLINFTTDTNFLGESIGIVLTPIMDMIKSLGGLSEMFKQLTGNVEEGAGAMDILKVVFFAWKKLIQLSTLPLRTIMKVLNLLFKMVKSRLAVFMPELQRLFAAFKSLQTAIQPIITVVQKLINDALGKLFGKIKGGLPIFKLMDKGLKALIKGFGIAVEKIEKFINSLSFTKKAKAVIAASNEELIKTEEQYLAAVEHSAKTQANIALDWLNSRKEAAKIEKEINDKKAADYKKYLANKDRLYQLYLDGLQDGRVKDELAESFRLKKALRGVKENSKEMEYQIKIHKNNMLAIKEKYVISDLELEKMRIANMDDSRQKDLDNEWLAYKEKLKKAGDNAKAIELVNIEHRHNNQKLHAKWDTVDLKQKEELFAKEQELEKSNFETEISLLEISEQEKKKLINDFQIKQLADKIVFLKQNEQLNEHQIKLLENQLLQLKNSIKLPESKRATSLFDFLGILDEDDKLKNALNDAGEEIENFYKKWQDTQIANAQKNIEISTENIDNLNEELDNEIAIQTLKQESGVAYDIGEIERLQKTLEQEKDLKAQQEEELAKQQRKAVLIQLGMDTASAISSLIKYAMANPLNATTSGIASAIQIGLGLAAIASNFALAREQLKSFGDGGLIEHGKSHKDGGTPILAEKGEFMMTTKATAENLPFLKLMNKGFSLSNIMQPNLINLETKERNTNDILGIERNNLLKKIARQKNTSNTVFVKTNNKFYN